MPFWIQNPYGVDRPGLADGFDIHQKTNYWRTFLAGYPLTPELRSHLPSAILIEGPKRRPMPDIFSLGFGACPNNYIVNERVRGLIEDLEPGIHTFLPVELIDERKQQTYGGCYYLYVGQTIDAIVIDKSDFKGGFGSEGYVKNPHLRLLGRNRVLDARKIAGKHLWRGGTEKLGGGGDPNGGILFCSDELAQLFKLNKVDGWVFDTPCSVV